MNNKILLPSLLEENDTEIRNIGHYTNIDSKGYLINPSNLSKLPNKWSNALEEMKSEYIERYNDSIHSIYVRGSVARGEPIDNVSDIDTVAITKNLNGELDKSWITLKNKELLNKYPFSTGFEFTFGSIEIFDDMNTPKAKSVAFTMKTQFTCIYGNDLIPTIPKMIPSREMAYLQVMKFNKSLSTGIKKLVERTDPDDIGKASVWLSKRILRAGFFLVMDLEKKLTKDLYPSYESFAKHYPNKSDEMYTVLYLALNPKSEKSVLLDFYKPFGEWLSNEINNKFNYLA